MKSGSLCALLWRLLSWCNLRIIVPQTCHITGRLNVIADKLSSHNQVIQTEWSLHQGIFNQICQRWHTPQIYLFATRFNKKLPLFMSPVPDNKAWVVTLSLSWEGMDGYVFPETPLITNDITKILIHDCHRIIVITLGWPNMSWFWDLVSQPRFPFAFLANPIS